MRKNAIEANVFSVLRLSAECGKSLKVLWNVDSRVQQTFKDIDKVLQ